MADTTIKIDSATRDRFNDIARQRGMSLRELMSELAKATPTPEELEVRRQATLAYLRNNLCPELTDGPDDAAVLWAKQAWMTAEKMQAGNGSQSAAR